jgi:hypothetical protein
LVAKDAGVFFQVSIQAPDAESDWHCTKVAVKY